MCSGKVSRSSAGALARVSLVAMLLSLPPLASASTGTDTRGHIADARAFVRIVRTLEADRTTIGHPSGVAFSSRATAFYVLPSNASPTATTVITKLTPFGVPSGSVRLPAPLADPANVAYDAHRGRLLLLVEPTVLLAVPEVGGTLDMGSASRIDVRSLGVKAARGITVDPRTGRLFILDEVGPDIVRVDPAADGGYTGAHASAISLRVGGAPEVRGLGFDPSTGHLQLLSPSRHALYEVAQTGELVATRDLTPFQLRRPQGVVIAPSGDTTDDPSQLSVYVADEGAATAVTPGAIVELSLVEPTAASAISFRSSLVRTTDTSKWTPPSPDPSGLAYLPRSGTLLMVDGEVEETVSGITHFAGANAWEMTLGGSVVRTANISKVAPTVVPMTNEPTGVAWNSTNGHYYVSDDSALRVYDDNPGSDGTFGTADDTWTSFDTTAAGSGDAEGVTYDSWHDRIFVADGVNAEIYEFTTSGSPVRHFDVQQYGVVDPESVEFNPDTGTLFVLSNHANPIIVETSTSGALLQTIDFSAAPQVAPAGLAYAPASDGSNTKRFYVVDRGIDNNSNPAIVDGKMFELTAPTATTPGNLPPTVDAGLDQTVELPNQALLDGTVTDDGVPNPPGAVTTTWTQESGPGAVTFENAAAVDTTAAFSSIGTYVLRLTATDGETSSADEVTVTATGAGGTSAIDVRVAAGSDDAEESASGAVSLASTDLELVNDGSDQVVGIRFNGLAIPRGAPIVNAYVQFAVDEATTGTAALTVAGSAADSPPTFTALSGDVSKRARTVASVAWSPPDWPTVGAVASAQRTPNLGAVIQEIVDRPGWSSGNSLVLLITGTGRRTAESFEGSPGTAPLLHVEYGDSAPANGAPTVAITAPANAQTFALATPITFTATANDAEDGDLTAGLTWTSNIDGVIGAGGNFTTSSLSVGTHTITAAAIDSGGATGKTQITLTVTGPDFLFADGFESGDLSVWSSSSSGNGDLSVTAAAALVGARGLQAVINDNQPIYVRDDTPQAETRYRARFYFDPNAITMRKGDGHSIFASADATGAAVLGVELRYVGGKYQLRPSLVTDAGTVTVGASAHITDAPHAVELSWRAATAPGANDGALTFWIDGAQVAAVSGIDNDTRRIERASLGAVAGIDAGTRGTYYFDSFEARRNTYIGP